MAVGFHQLPTSAFYGHSCDGPTGSLPCGAPATLPEGSALRTGPRPRLTSEGQKRGMAFGRRRRTERQLFDQAEKGALERRHTALLRKQHQNMRRVLVRPPWRNSVDVMTVQHGWIRAASGAGAKYRACLAGGGARFQTSLQNHLGQGPLLHRSERRMMAGGSDVRVIWPTYPHSLTWPKFRPDSDPCLRFVVLRSCARPAVGARVTETTNREWHPRLACGPLL
jgi:hypothetical protein